MVAALAAFILGIAGLLLGARSDTREGLVSVIHVASYCAGVYLAWKIADEHRNSPPVRLAWILIAGSSAASVFRHTAFLLHGFHYLDWLSPASYYLLTQIPMALAVLLFLAGLITMWSAFSVLGLGFHARRMDIGLLMSIVMLTPLVLLSRGIQNPTNLIGPAVILRYAGPLLLPACAGIAVLLHRIAYQMRGGDMARALRCLILYPVIRLVSALLALNPSLRSVDILFYTQYSMMQAVPIIFTLGLAYRWRITVRASKAFEQQEFSLAEPIPISGSPILL